MTGGATPDLADLLPVLVHVQTHLADDLSLERLARVAGRPPSTFHRRFRAAMGATPKQYTARLRLERAAFELRIRDATILEIALDVGFRSHEVFTRAFARHFGRTPSAFRDRPRRRQDNDAPARTEANRYATSYSLSATRVQRVRALDVAFVRHHGPYRDVDPALFDRVLRWALDHDLVEGDPIRMAVGHDTPSVTPEERLRFDACVQVRGAFTPADGVGHQRLPAGPYASTTYVGPFGAPLEEAYGRIFRASSELRGYELVGLPAVEVYGSTELDDRHALHHTEILLPLRRRAV